MTAAPPTSVHVPDSDASAMLKWAIEGGEAALDRSSHALLPTDTAPLGQAALTRVSRSPAPIAVPLLPQFFSSLPAYPSSVKALLLQSITTLPAPLVRLMWSYLFGIDKDKAAEAEAKADSKVAPLSSDSKLPQPKEPPKVEAAEHRARVWLPAALRASTGRAWVPFKCTAETTVSDAVSAVLDTLRQAGDTTERASTVGTVQCVAELDPSSRLKALLCRSTR